jgi:hypothetical protein
VAAAVAALRTFDRLYPQASGESATQQLIVQLAAPAPFDLERTSLREYKHLISRWHDWRAVREACRSIAVALMDSLGR